VAAVVGADGAVSGGGVKGDVDGAGVEDEVASVGVTGVEGLAASEEIGAGFVRSAWAVNALMELRRTAKANGFIDGLWRKRLLFQTGS
jgi:hypothetical protein